MPHYQPLGSSSLVKNCTGIYCIHNIHNNRNYVGKACQSIGGRLKNHFDLMAQGKHHSKLMQADFREQGEQVFFYEILQDIPRRAPSPLFFDVMEYFWIDTLNPEYNTRKNSLLKGRLKEQLRCVLREQKALKMEIEELSQRLSAYKEKFDTNHQKITFINRWLEKRQALMQPQSVPDQFETWNTYQ